MEIRQEQVVFLVVAALIAYLAFGAGDGSERRASRPRGPALELERFEAPDVSAAALAAHGDDIDRGLLSPPRDTRPLDPLAFEPPPLPPPRALAPLPAYAPAPVAYARLLPTRVAAVATDGLFDASEAEFDSASASLQDLVDFGYIDAPSAPADELGDLESEFLDAEERRQREETYKTLYDWIRVGEFQLQFGRIENEYPYGLRDPERLDEPLLFREYDPAQGVPRFRGAPPIEYGRDRLTDFALADTVENDLRQRYHDLPEEASPASVETMLLLAQDCIDARLEVAGALDLAEDVYLRLGRFLTEDPRPGLGLARVHEAAFEFERAFEQYRALLERFAHRADVLVPTAELEARFHLYDAAEQRLRAAVAAERGSYVGHAALGRFLLERGRFAAARAALAAAFARLPQDPLLADERLAIRLDYGAALVAVGAISEASQVFGDAFRAEPDSQGALAGLASCALLGDGDARGSLPEWLTSGEATFAEGFEALGYDLLLSSGLLAAEAGELARAVTDLRAAVEADPLRAARAWCALAWVAERAGEVDEALTYVERALEADPENVWALYTRARLLLERDDTVEAAATFQRALELEADFEDALVGLGVAAWRDGRVAEAELYFERAMLLVDERLEAVRAGADTARLGADPRVDALGLRGINLLEIGAFLRARETFERALAHDSADSVARGGLAWTIYRLGDVEEALIQLRGIDDSLRGRPEDDPVRVWARERLAALDDHVSKDIWSDDFEYSTVGNGWSRHEAAGPTASMRDGTLVLSGNFKRVDSEARFDRTYVASEFVAIEASIRISGDSNARAGLFVSREQGSGDRRKVQAYAGVARSRDGVGQVRALTAGTADKDWRDLPDVIPFPADEWVRLRIEREGDGADTVVTIFVDGIPVLEGVPMTNLARGNSPLVVGLFAEGDTGRRVEVAMDDVEIVRRSVR